MAEPRARLEALYRWRQAAAWAPIVWFPLAVTGFSLGRAYLAITVALSGLAFTGLCVTFVWFARCPACDARIGRSRQTFRFFWDGAGCEACGVSLFELRRRDGGQRG